MYHCTKFKADNIWYLEPNELFEERELRFGTCPRCEKKVIELKERRKIDSKIFISRITQNLERVINKERNNLIYKTEDLKNLPNLPYGWIFGINTENKSGKVKQFSCDWFGNKKELILTN